jgi:hypothetical protein
VTFICVLSALCARTSHDQYATPFLQRLGFYISGESGTLVDNYPEAAYFRDIVFTFKMFMGTAKDALPVCQPYMPPQARLRWKFSASAGFVVRGFGKELSCARAQARAIPVEDRMSEVDASGQEVEAKQIGISGPLSADDAYDIFAAYRAKYQVGSSTHVASVNHYSPCLAFGYQTLAFFFLFALSYLSLPCLALLSGARAHRRLAVEPV